MRSHRLQEECHHQVAPTLQGQECLDSKQIKLLIYKNSLNRKFDLLSIISKCSFFQCPPHAHSAIKLPEEKRILGTKQNPASKGLRPSSKLGQPYRERRSIINWLTQQSVGWCIGDEFSHPSHLGN